MSTVVEVHAPSVWPPGTLCQWCREDEATTTIYGWATCLTCIASRRERVRRWTLSVRTQGGH